MTIFADFRIDDQIPINEDKDVIKAMEVATDRKRRLGSSAKVSLRGNSLAGSMKKSVLLSSKKFEEDTPKSQE